MAKPTATMTLSMREANPFKTVQAVIDRMRRVGLAAQWLGISRRQLERFVQRDRSEGNGGFVSRSRGRPSNHQLAPGIAQRGMLLIKERYADFGRTLACEKLRECHGLLLGKETVGTLMIAACLWTPRNRRAPQIHQPRNRRDCLGQMIQIDGSDHARFECWALACMLLVFIDGATSRLMQLRFVPTVSAFAYSQASWAIWSSTASPWRPTATRPASFARCRNQRSQAEGATQFRRALFELNINIICANTSEAKGSVERANCAA